MIPWGRWHAPGCCGGRRCRSCRPRRPLHPVGGEQRLHRRTLLPTEALQVAPGDGSDRPSGCTRRSRLPVDSLRYTEPSPPPPRAAALPTWVSTGDLVFWRDDPERGNGEVRCAEARMERGRRVGTDDRGDVLPTALEPSSVLDRPTERARDGDDRWRVERVRGHDRQGADGRPCGPRRRAATESVSDLSAEASVAVRRRQHGPERGDQRHGGGDALVSCCCDEGNPPL